MNTEGWVSMVAAMAMCWLLNVAQVGIAFLMLVFDDRTLPVVFVLGGMVGIVQVGYVVPIWRLLQRKGKTRAAKGVLVAAAITLVINAGVWIVDVNLRNLMP